jgi:hypothetical protein
MVTFVNGNVVGMRMRALQQNAIADYSAEPRSI